MQIFNIYLPINLFTSNREHMVSNFVLNRLQCIAVDVIIRKYCILFSESPLLQRPGYETNYFHEKKQSASLYREYNNTIIEMKSSTISFSSKPYTERKNHL